MLSGREVDFKTVEQIGKVGFNYTKIIYRSVLSQFCF